MITLEQALARYPKEHLATFPTPLHRLEHLSAKLGFDVYIKRDDLTELALGGDKPRKLEYEIAQARDKGVDTLVTCGSAQSNHARLTTAAARKLGLKVAVVLSHDEWDSMQGNLLTVHLMGAHVVFVHTDDHWELESHARELCDTLRAKGHKPHYIPVSGSTPHSCLGYVSGGLEVIEQMARLAFVPDAVYTPFGTGGTFTSLMLTLRDKGFECPMIGISVNRELQRCEENLDRWWNALSSLLERDPKSSRGSYEIFDEFIGKEYGDPTPAGLDAILLLARTEGILLDPVYSGKVMSGLLAHAREGRWKSGQKILFLHTGGVPALFSYHAVLAEHLKSRPDHTDKF